MSAPDEPPFIPTSRFDVPFEELGRMEWQNAPALFVQGIVVAAVVIPPGSGFGSETKPGVQIAGVTLDGQATVPMILPLDHRRKSAELAKLFGDAGRGAWRAYDEHRASLDAEARTEAKVEALGEVFCSICGARIFGEVALRGACLSCAPELPPEPGRTIEPRPRKPRR